MGAWSLQGWTVDPPDEDERLLLSVGIRQSVLLNMQSDTFFHLKMPKYLINLNLVDRNRHTAERKN